MNDTTGARSINLIDLRRADAALRARVLTLNNAHAAETSELDADRLSAMLAAARLTLCDADGTAFVLTFDEGSDYDSVNYLWFRNAFPRFLYVDRIVVAAHLRGTGRARALYTAVFAAARASGRDIVACEVNITPPNPTSDAFHSALGFAEVGRGTPSPGKTVRYMTCGLGGQGRAGT